MRLTSCIKDDRGDPAVVSGMSQAFAEARGGPSTGETTIFVYDAAGQPHPSTPAPKRSHPSSGRRGAVHSTVVASAEDARVAYLTADHLGSPRINTDRDGKVTSRHDFHPYGEEIITAQRTSHASTAVAIRNARGRSG